MKISMIVSGGTREGTGGTREGTGEDGHLPGGTEEGNRGSVVLIQTGERTGNRGIVIREDTLAEEGATRGTKRGDKEEGATRETKRGDREVTVDTMIDRTALGGGTFLIEITQTTIIEMPGAVGETFGEAGTISDVAGMSYEVVVRT